MTRSSRCLTLSKLSKFLTKPHVYLRDAAWNAAAAFSAVTLSHEQVTNGKPTAILVGFSDWKTFIVDFLSDHNVIFLGHNPRLTSGQIRSIGKFPNPHVFAWSYKFPPMLREYCRRRSIPLTFVEDGFIRSFGLGASKSKPLSLVFDSKAMHFDRSARSVLEDILSTHDFAADTELMREAAALAEQITNSGLSKYNFAAARSRVKDVVGTDPQRRVLVLGQVEDDLSMKYGAVAPISGNDLVVRALYENPGAVVMYRPHPESLAFAKPHYSNPAAVEPFCHIVGTEYPLKECIEAADLVYTVTSLAGFEAALQGKHVVTLGRPFYSGWGFTEDRDPNAKRQRQLTPLEVLAGAYIKYPRYYHPITNAQIGALAAVESLHVFRQAAYSVAERRALLAKAT